jgi:hypothetical protein
LESSSKRKKPHLLDLENEAFWFRISKKYNEEVEKIDRTKIILRFELSQ